MRGGRDLVVNRLPSSLRPVSNSSQWAVALGIMGYGYGTAVLSVINGNEGANAEQLARLPESERFSGLLLLAAADLERGVTYPNFSIKTLVRAWQRFEVGRALYEETARASNPFFVVDPGEQIDRVEQILTERVEGYGPIGADCIRAKREIRTGESWPTLTKVLGGIVLGAAVVGGAALVYKSQKR